MHETIRKSDTEGTQYKWMCLMFVRDWPNTYVCTWVKGMEKKEEEREEDNKDSDEKEEEDATTMMMMRMRKRRK